MINITIPKIKYVQDMIFTIASSLIYPLFSCLGTSINNMANPMIAINKRAKLSNISLKPAIILDKKPPPANLII